MSLYMEFTFHLCYMFLKFSTGGVWNLNGSCPFCSRFSFIFLVDVFLVDFIHCIWHKPNWKLEHVHFALHLMEEQALVVFSTHWSKIDSCYQNTETDRPYCCCTFDDCDWNNLSVIVISRIAEMSLDQNDYTVGSHQKLLSWIDRLNLLLWSNDW